MNARPHRKYTITLDWLKRKGACRDGLDFAKPLCPAVISTDPDDNMELAHMVAGDFNGRINAFGSCEDGVARFLMWLAVTAGVYLYDQVREPRAVDGVPYLAPDVCAQHLAWIADVLLTRGGK